MAYKKNYDKEAFAKKQKEKTDKLKKMIEDEITTFKEDPKQLAEYLSFASRFYKYSPKNQLLIYLQNPGATFVASYENWKKKGYAVEKGQTGEAIFVPVVVNICSLPDEFMGTRAYSLLTDRQKKRIDYGEGKIEEKRAFKIGTVFDISQTNCPKEDYPKLLNPGIASEKHGMIYEGFKDYVIKKGIVATEKPAIYFKSISIRGTCNIETGEITIRDNLEDTAKLGTFIHEYAHSQIHVGNNEKPSYQKEFEADAFTIMMLTELGLEIPYEKKDHMKNAYSYFSLSADDKDNNEDEFENSLKVVMDKFKEVKEEIIPHIQEYINNRANNVIYPPSLTANPNMIAESRDRSFDMER